MRALLFESMYLLPGRSKKVVTKKKFRKPTLLLDDDHANRSENYTTSSDLDRGVGFKLQTTSTAGLGLVSMQERVQIVQGKIHIQSAPDEGTFIRVYVPITWKEQKSGHEKKGSKTHAAAG